MPKKKQKNSRGIGARAELEVAKLLRESGFAARRGQQYKGTSDSPDVVVADDLKVIAHIEVKRVNRLMSKLMKEAIDKAEGECDFQQRPVLVHREPRREWMVTVDARWFFHLLRKAV